jgi:hypothetical protein
MDCYPIMGELHWLYPNHYTRMVISLNKEALKKLTPEELIDLSENNNGNFRYNRSVIYQVAFEKYNEIDDDHNKEKMRKESIAFDVSTNEFPEKRFGEKYIILDEEGDELKYPNMNKDFSKESMEYYKQRVNETQNPILKARYSDLVWEFDKDFTCAQQAIVSYLECSAIYFDQEWDNEATDSVIRACYIALQINHKEYIEQALDKVYELITALSVSNRFRYILEVTDFLLKNERKLGNKLDLPVLISLLEKAIVYYRKNEDDTYHLQRRFLETLVMAQKDIEAAHNTRVRIAETYVEEAEWKRINYLKGNMVAATFFEKALEMYQNLGKYPKKVEELKIKIIECNELARETEISEISTPFEIPHEVIDDYMSLYRVPSVLDFFQVMVVDPHLLPSWDECVKQAQEQSKQFVFQHLADTHIMRGNITVKKVTDEKEKLEYNAIQNLQLRYKFITSMLLEEMFCLLKNEHGDYRQQLFEFLAETGTISEHRVKIIRVGIDRYYEQDYVSAIHLLVFQIEGILRDMIGKLGLPTFSYRNNEMRERMLSDIIGTLSQIKEFNQDFLQFTTIILNDLRGDNLRNDIAHGLASIEVMNKSNVELLIYILLKLSSYKVERKGSKEN